MGKCALKRTLEKPRVVWLDNIKVDVRDIFCGMKRDGTGCDYVPK